MSQWTQYNGRADWLASPLTPIASGYTYGIPTGAALRAQRLRQAETESDRLKCATDEARAFVREGARRAARDGIGAGRGALADTVAKFSRGLARRLCDGASMRGHAHLRTNREGYRKSNTVAKYWGDMQRQCASEIESALWFHSGVLLSRYGMPSLTGERPGREEIAILRAIRSRFVVIHSLRDGERILRRMSHRTEEAEAFENLALRPDEGAVPARWQPEAEAVNRLREAIQAGARNAPTAARMLALLDSILSGRPPAGANASHAIGRMLAAAAAGGFAEPDSWRAYSGARISPGRPALVTA